MTLAGRRERNNRQTVHRKKWSSKDKENEEADNVHHVQQKQQPGSCGMPINYIFEGFVDENKNKKRAKNKPRKTLTILPSFTL